MIEFQLLSIYIHAMNTYKKRHEAGENLASKILNLSVCCNV